MSTPELQNLAENTFLGALFLLVLISIGLNAVVILYGLRTRSQLLSLRRTVTGMLGEAIKDLQRFERLVIKFDIEVNDRVPIRTSVPIDERLDVTVQGHIPIRQTLNTEVILHTPLLGRMPMNVTVPLDLQVPIDLHLPIIVNQAIPIALEVPVQLEVPIEVDLHKTELGSFIDQVRSSLDRLYTLVGANSGPPPA